MSHFKLISSTKASDVIPVNKYVSEKTGITVVIGEVEGPLVNGFFCFATEAHDDDGLPHTLEHLIFLGSKRYPYKGILDLLANRCMAHGTNAWTDTDHTCYTVYTAGDEGMLTLLPIYLDHILFPTLTDQGFITEVHHIDGDGNDAGVVYCEMQGRENSADSRCQLKLLRAMYPDNGYSSETGGIMKNLRESTDNTKVRDFHKKFYRPENLMIILTGQINAQDVFKSLEVVEDDIIARRANESVEDWVRPWQDIPPPPLLGELREYWPADTEDCGQVVLGWRGPVLREAGAARALTAAATLLRYLCDTAAAPLQRCLVQREDARAGDVSYNLVENMATLIKIELDNVPVGKLDLAKDEALQCLKSLRDGNEPIDMDRINRLLKKELRESKASLESDPHHVVAFRSIGDALYSQNEQDFISRMNPQEDITSLMSEPAEYWAGILRRYFTDRPVCVLGSPSVALQDRMAEEEKNRIEEQRKSLGTSGLEEKKKALQEAIEFNERPPPSGTLSSVGIPSCDNLKCHALASWATGGDCPHMDVQRLPIYARVHSLKTNFVYISVLLDTSTMEEWMRKWIPLHVNGLAECAVLREGKIIPHEQVITTTEELTASFSVAVGFGKSASFSVGSFGHFIHIDTRCEPEDYEKVVNHLYEILFTAQITKERLLVFVQRLINDVAHLRRDGHKMVYDSLRDFVYIHNSNNHWCSVLRQHTFLKQLLESLTAGGESAQTVLNRAIDTYKALTNHLWLHLATDFDRYKLSAEPWMKFAPENAIAQPPQLYSERSLMQPRTGGFVAGVGGLESSFLAQFSPGPDSPAPHTLAPLLVAINYFTQLEGPMWRLIRGSGLSYGYGVRAAPGEGRLVFLLYRAANTLAAYNVAMDILVGFEKEPVFEEDLFASAKSTALFEVVENEKCPADVVRHSLINYLQGVEHDYNRRLVSAVSAVSGAAAVAAARRWLPALAADTACLAVVCHPAKVKDMQADFLKAGVKLEAFESLENSHFNK